MGWQDFAVWGIGIAVAAVEHVAPQFEQPGRISPLEKRLFIEVPQPLQIALAQIQDPRIQNWPLRMAGCVIAMTPLLVMYLISQKYVLKGVSVSAGFKG